MLCELSIRNFAIIDDLKIHFYEGLSVLSGETGAGKSIIVNAVNLLLGSRAHAGMVRGAAEAAELEALFKIEPDSRAAAAMADHGYDATEGLLIRRIISLTSRHRAYINGRLATMDTLNAITENLASISGQHAHQKLLREPQHLLVLDQFAGLMPLRAEVAICFHAIAPLWQNRRKLIQSKARQAEQRELLLFQKKEIDEAAIDPGSEGKADEDKRLEQERTRLKNADQLYQAAYECLESLYDGQGAIIERLTGACRRLEPAAEIDRALATHIEGMADAAFRLEDTTEALRNYLQNIHIDPQRLEAVEDRLDTLNKLKRKYGGSLEAVLAYCASIDEELSGIENIDAQITALETELTQKHAELKRHALRLSKNRKKIARKLAAKIEKALADLKMADTRFDIALHSDAAENDANPYLASDGHAITETGLDRAAFLIAPNVGERLKTLAQIASGGELSRIVLALKAILAETDTIETIVFDEVDAGIGGSVAEVVGRKLSELALHHQIICITHLPQIAKFSAYHFKITKQVIDGRTQTAINKLGPQARIQELARMMGGEKITPATLAHAREMIKKAK